MSLPGVKSDRPSLVPSERERNALLAENLIWLHEPPRWRSRPAWKRQWNHTPTRGPRGYEYRRRGLAAEFYAVSLKEID